MPKILSLENKEYFEYAGACGGYVDSLGYPYCRGRVFDDLEKDENQYDSVEEVFWTSGAAMVIRSELYNKLGGFDKDYFAHMEEIDLCWRIKRAGYNLKVVPDSIVYHLGGGTMSYEDPRKLKLNFRNSLFTIFKNESWWKLIWLLPLRLILDGIAGFKFLLEGKGKLIISILKAHFEFYSSIPSLLEKRREGVRIINDINPTIRPFRSIKELTPNRVKSIILNFYFFGNKTYSKMNTNK